jgi:hypothetical protein
VALWFEKGPHRLQWMLVTATILTGTLTSLWLVRVMTFVGPIAPLGGIWAMMQLDKWLRRHNAQKPVLWTFVLLLPFASIPWALALGGEEKSSKPSSEECRASAAFAPFTALPPGLILAPINAGSHLLAFTSHSVLAAPYHRNNQGNRVVLDSFLAPLDQSRAIVMASGAKYVAICAGLGETSVAATSGAKDLGSALAEGQVPDWLVPVSAANTPYRIFTIRH